MILDDDETSKVCTTSDTKDLKYLTFRRSANVIKPTKKIDLKFEQMNNRHARITDLKIYYTEQLCIKIKAGLVLLISKNAITGNIILSLTSIFCVLLSITPEYKVLLIHPAAIAQMLCSIATAA